MEKHINKNIIILFLIATTAISQAGLVLYTPAFVQIAHALNISPSLVKFTLTGYLFGFGISQLIYGPISDHMGRKKLLLIGTAIFILGCLWAMFADNFSSLLLSRIVQGLGAGAYMTLMRCIVRDCFEGKQYVKMTTYLSSGFAIGLGLTPVIGGHLTEYFSWHADFIFLLITGILLFVGLAFLLPETHHPKPSNLSVPKATRQTFSHFYSCLKNRNFICYLIGGVMAYGVVIAYTTMTPFLFQKSLGVSASFYGWLTLIVASAYYAATAFNRAYVTKIGMNAMMKIGLALILLSGLTMLISISVFHAFSLYVVLIPLLVATFGQAIIWSNSIAGALKDLAHISGSASAFFGCLQMLLSALICAVVAIPHDHNQLPLSITVIALGLISWFVFGISIFRKQSTKPAVKPV